MRRIAVSGFQHETNTFGATRAGMAEFEMADAWPPLLRGSEVLTGTRGINLPVAGFVAAAEAAGGAELLPLLWCSAEPSAHVADAAFERIAGEICERLAAAGPLDGVYLDLHGAMVTESLEDGEGELLARIRGVVGPDLPVVASLDLHANVTPGMVRHASALAIFRTYPHLDMAETGARAFALLSRLMAGERLAAAFRQAPFLVPLTAQHTGSPPCRELYAMLGELDAASADLAMGFPAADIADAGPSVVAYAGTRAAAEAAADRLAAALLAAEGAFHDPMLPAAEAVARAMAHPGPWPVVIADAQDNPGAGGTSDTTGLLAALAEGGAQGAVLGLLDDPAMAARAHAAGTGAVLEGALGGRSGLPGLDPFVGRFRVEALGDGRFPFTGEMYAGAEAHLGPTALLRVLDDRADLRVIVGSVRCQCLDRAIFMHLGVDPAAERILAVKSTVHYRADFEPIAGLVLTAEAPGAFPCRLERVPYRRLRPGMRLGPSGPPHAPAEAPAREPGPAT